MAGMAQWQIGLASKQAAVTGVAQPGEEQDGLRCHSGTDKWESWVLELRVLKPRILSPILILGAKIKRWPTGVAQPEEE